MCGHKLSNGVLFAHHLILGVPGGSSHLAYRRRVPPGHNPHTRVNCFFEFLKKKVVEKNGLGARNPYVRLVWHESKLCGNQRPKSEVICPGVGKQARPRFQSLRWKTNALWSQQSNLSARYASIQ